MSLKKNFHHFVSSLKQIPNQSLQTRKARLEMLEPRQLLTAVAFTTVESNMFQAELNNVLDAEDVSDRYCVLQVVPAEGTQFDASALTITDSNDEVVEVLSTKVENGTTSILAKYTLGEKYVFEVASDATDVSYDARFIMAGDLDGENDFTTAEYNTLWGEVQKGFGVNSRFLETYKNIYGVNIALTRLDPIYDLNGNGKLTLETFDTLLRPNYEDPLQLDQEIVSVPIINDLKVNGKEPTQIEGEKYSYVTNESADLTISGKTLAEECAFTYEDALGETYTGTIDLTKAGTYSITNADDETEKITLTYSISEDETFALAFPEDSFRTGSITMKLWSDAEHSLDPNSYVISIVLDEPEIFVEEATIDGAEQKEGVYQVKSADFDVTVSMDVSEDATLQSITNAMENPTQGVYIRISENDEEITKLRKKLDSSILTEVSEGNVTVSDVEISLSGVTAGAHTYKITVTDLAGNIYDEKSVEVKVNVDLVAPTITVTGYTENEEVEGQKVMLVEEDSLTLGATTDDEEATLTCEQNGTLVSPTEEGGSSYEFQLENGLNTIVFTAVDLAGNSSETVCRVYYSVAITLSEEGEDLEENGLTHKYEEDETPEPLDLYDYFNYDSGLTFTVEHENQDLVTLTETDGVLEFTYLQTPAEGETLTDSVVVTAQNSFGKSCTLTFALKYTNVETPTFWSDVTVENDLADVSLADINHIVAENRIVFSGILTVPAGASEVRVNVYHGEETLLEKISLEESSTGTGYEYTLDETTGQFTLKLTDLEDGEYLLSAFVTGEETKTRDVEIYVETAEPAVTVEISTTSPLATNPKFTLTAEGTPSDLDAELGTWANIYYASVSTPAKNTLYARAKYNPETKAFGELTYFITEALEDGTYIFTSETENAATLTAEGGSQTVVIDTQAPIITVDGYSVNYGYEDPEILDSMLVTTDQLTLITSTNEAATKITMTCTHNGVAIGGTQREDGTWSFTFTLGSDLNTIIFTAVDSVGNSSSKTCKVVLGPQVSEVGEALEQNGLTQAVGSEKNKTVDLNTLFDFDGDLSYEAVSSEEDFVTLSISEEGILSFHWLEEPEGTPLKATIGVAATPINSTVAATLQFEVTLVSDQSAPVWTNLVVTDDLSDESMAEFDGHILGKGAIELTGTLFDASQIRSAGLTILCGTETIRTLNLLEDFTDETCSYTYDDANSTFALTLTGLETGEYAFHIYGEDVNGNQSSMEDESAQVENFLIELESPTVLATMTVQKTGISETLVNKNPTFTLTATGTPSDLDAEYGTWANIYVQTDSSTWVLYAQAKYDEETEAFGEISYFITRTLTDGTWKFQIETENAALHSSKTSECEKSIEIDTVPPIIEALNYESDYDSSDYGTYQMEGTNYDSIYLDEMYAPDDEYDLGLDFIDLHDVSFEVNLYHASTRETEIVDGSLPLPLTYGENVAIVTGTDEAGNATQQTYKLFLNDTPEESETGLKIEYYGFDQIVTSKSNWKTLDLNTCFTDSASLKFQVENLDEEAGEISVKLSDDGILSFTYKVTPTEEDPEYTASIQVLATDEFGMETEMFFNVNYFLDSDPPTVEDVSLEGDPELQHVILGTNEDSIVLNGMLYDRSSIETAQLTLIYAATETSEGKTLIEDFNLLKNSSGTTLDGVNYVYTYTPDSTLAGGTFMLALSQSDGTPMEEGNYFFYVAAKDSSGNSSLEGGDFDPEIISVLVDRTTPNLSANMTLVRTGTSSTTVNANPRFNVSFEGTDSEKYGTWVQIYYYAMKDDGTREKILYAQQKYKGESLVLTNSTKTLAEGNYEFCIQTISATGNTNENPDSLWVTIDRTKPVISSVSISEKTDCTTILIKTVIHSNLYVTTNLESGCILYYSDSATGSGTVYSDETGIELDFGQNTIYFWGVDSAGNVGERKSCVFEADQKPFLTESAKQLENQKIVLDQSKTTVQFTLDKAELDAMVDDENLTRGDELTRSFAYTRPDGVEDSALSLDFATSTDGMRYVLTLTYDYNQVQALSDLGAVSFVVTDSYGFSPEDSQGLLTFNLLREVDVSAPEITEFSLVSGSEKLELDSEVTYTLEVATRVADGVYAYTIQVKNEEAVLLETITLTATSKSSASLAISGNGLSPLSETSRKLDAGSLFLVDALRFTVTNPNGSDSVDLTLVTTGESMVMDASLDPYREETFSGTTTEDAIVPQTSTVQATIKTESILEAETILASGSKLSHDAFDEAASDYTKGTDYTLETQRSGLELYVLQKDLTLKQAVTTDSDCTVSVTRLGEETFLKAGTTLQSELEVVVPDIEQIVSIYEDFDEEDLSTYLTYTIPKSELVNSATTISGIVVPQIASSHAIKSIKWVDGKGIVVTYRPYQVSQDRTPVTIQVNCVSGEKSEQIDYEINLFRETPFELSTTVTTKMVSVDSVETLPSSRSTISTSAGTYYAQVWFQMNLPTASERFIEAYSTYALGALIVTSFNKEAVSKVTCLNGLAPSYAETDDFLTAQSAVAEAKELGADLRGADGTWFCLEQYKIETTGEANLEISTNINTLETGYPFEFDETTQAQTGVKLAAVNNSQKIQDLEKTIPLEPSAVESVGIFKAVPEVVSVQSQTLALTVDDSELTVTDAIQESALLESVDSLNSSVQESTPIVVDEIADEVNPFGLSVESWLQEPEATTGCSTLSATNIVPESELLAVIEASPAIQREAKALTDEAFKEELE